MSYVIGVDIGGSHITAAMVDPATGQVLDESRNRRLVNAKGPSNEIISAWCAAIKKAAAARLTDNAKIGIAMPGPFDYDEGVCLIKQQEKFRQLYGINIKIKLSQALQLPPENIRFLNDAVSFLQGEILYGAARGAESALGLTLGTGLGSAVYKNGKIADADLWNARFRDGIAEAYLSTGWFVKTYEEMSGKALPGVRELMDIADARALAKIFSAFTENLVLFLVPQTKKRQVERIVFGGNICAAGAYFLPSLKVRLAEAGLQVSVDQALLGEDAALLGAAGCWSHLAQLEVPNILGAGGT